MHETHSIKNTTFYDDLWKNYGDSLSSWFFIAIIPLALLFIIHRKGNSRTMSLIGTGIVSAVWVITLLGFHWIMSFGEAFVEGIDKYRSWTWAGLTVLTIAIFTTLNAKKPPLQNKTLHPTTHRG